MVDPYYQPMINLVFLEKKPNQRTTEDTKAFCSMTNTKIMGERKMPVVSKTA